MSMLPCLSGIGYREQRDTILPCSLFRPDFLFQPFPVWVLFHFPARRTRTFGCLHPRVFNASHYLVLDGSAPAAAAAAAANATTYCVTLAEPDDVTTADVTAADVSAAYDYSVDLYAHTPAASRHRAVVGLVYNVRDERNYDYVVFRYRGAVLLMR